MDIEEKRERLRSLFLDASESELDKEIEKIDAYADELGEERGAIKSMFFGQFLLLLGGLMMFAVAPYAFGGDFPQELCLVFPGIAIMTLPGSILWWRQTGAAFRECGVVKELIGGERKRRERVRELYGGASA